MVNRRITRTIYNTTEITSAIVSPGGTQAWVVLTTDAVYVGFHGRFTGRYFQIGTANTNASVASIDYWDGDSWAAVDDLVDQTSLGGKTFAQSGFITWTNKADWALRNLTGTDADLELYWVRLTVSADLSAGTTLGAIMNLFSDDALLRIYYPELISDTAYLPTSKTNFLDQHIAAKDLVVLRLKQKKAIEDESQIIDQNDVAVASVHGCAWIILRAIATSPDSIILRDEALKAFEDELSNITKAIDSDNSGTITESERSQALSVNIYRR